MLLLASWLFRLSTLHLSLRILFPPITQFNLPNSPKNKQNWPLFSTPASTAPPSGPVSCHQPCLDLPTGLHASFHPSPRPLSTQCSFQNPGGSVSIGNHQWRLKSLDNSLADSKPPLIRGKTDFHRWKKKTQWKLSQEMKVNKRLTTHTSCCDTLRRQACHADSRLLQKPMLQSSLEGTSTVQWGKTVPSTE